MNNPRSAKRGPTLAAGRPAHSRRLVRTIQPASPRARRLSSWFCYRSSGDLFFFFFVAAAAFAATAFVVIVVVAIVVAIVTMAVHQ